MLRKIHAISRSDKRTKCVLDTCLDTICSSQDRVDCSRRLAIVFAEQMGIDTQRDVRLGVTETPAEGDDVDIRVDELACVSVPQGTPLCFSTGDRSFAAEFRVFRSLASCVDGPVDHDLQIESLRKAWLTE